MEKVNKSMPDFAVIHTDILNNENLSLQAIGLAAKMTCIEMSSRDYKKTIMEIWKMIEDFGYHTAYQELVKNEVIEDFIKEFRHE
jgi:hypothetical protein